MGLVTLDKVVDKPSVVGSVLLSVVFAVGLLLGVVDVIGAVGVASSVAAASGVVEIASVDGLPP